jgi:hypothetical protein
MQRDISGFMVVDITSPSEPGFLIDGGGFSADFSKGYTHKVLEDAVEEMLEQRDRPAYEGYKIRVISLTAIQFDLVDDTVAEDTLIESIEAKLTADELRIIRRHIRAS